MQAVPTPAPEPAPASAHEITALLQDWGAGDRRALDRLMPLVAQDLRKLAGHRFLRERADHTLQPTALVNEVYLRLVRQKGSRWENRAQFYGFVAGEMRRILISHARGKLASKRGGDFTRVPIDDLKLKVSLRPEALLALDEALDILERVSPRQARIVELRFFIGLTIQETAEVIGVSPATVKNEWSVARAWLYSRIANSAAPTDVPPGAQEDSCPKPRLHPGAVA